MKSINKIFSSMLIVSILTLFASCSEDDEVKTSATKADLVGKWTLKSTNNELLINEKSAKTYLVEELGYSQEEADEVIGWYEIDAGTGTVIEFRSDNKTLYRDAEEDDFEEEGNWSLSSDGKKVIVGDGTDDDTIFDIKSISKNNLSLVLSNTDEVDMDYDGQDDFNLTVITTLNLEK